MSDKGEGDKGRRRLDADVGMDLWRVSESPAGTPKYTILFPTVFWLVQCLALPPYNSRLLFSTACSGQVLLFHHRKTRPTRLGGRRHSPRDGM
jgi:hypothetical protein